MMHSEDYERRLHAWWVLPNQNILPVVDQIHGDAVLKNKSMFGIKDDQEIYDYFVQNPNRNFYPDYPAFNAALYVVLTKKGVRSGINFASYDHDPTKTEGYVEGDLELLNKLKNTIYTQLVINGANTVFVDTTNNHHRRPIPVDKFRRITYTS